MRTLVHHGLQLGAVAAQFCFRLDVLAIQAHAHGNHKAQIAKLTDVDRVDNACIYQTVVHRRKEKQQYGHSQQRRAPSIAAAILAIGRIQQESKMAQQVEIDGPSPGMGHGLADDKLLAPGQGDLAQTTDPGEQDAIRQD